MGEGGFPLEGVYQGLSEKILNGYRVEGNHLVVEGEDVEFRTCPIGYEIFLGAQRLGTTTEDFFLVHLTELFEDDDADSLERLRRFADDKRLIQAVELQSTIRAAGREFEIGSHMVGYSRRYFDCDCPDWKFRRKLGGCKHIAALRLLDV